MEDISVFSVIVNQQFKHKVQVKRQSVSWVTTADHFALSLGV